jgi:hypothetical protein
MLPHAFWISLRLLAFRAGPEDFPYDASNRVSLACIAFAVLVNAALTAVAGEMGVLMKALTETPPLWADIVLGAVSVAAMGLFTRLALRARQLESRFQQTYNALLATSSMLSLLMVLPIRQLLPFLPVAQELSKKVTANPDLVNDPTVMSALPGWTLLFSLMIPALLAWQFAVTAFIYRRAANTRAGGGVFIALLCVLTVMSLKDIFTLLLQ